MSLIGISTWYLPFAICFLYGVRCDYIQQTYHLHPFLDTLWAITGYLMSIQRFVSYFNWVFIRYSVTRSEYQCAILHDCQSWDLQFNRWLVAIQFSLFMCLESTFIVRWELIPKQISCHLFHGICLSVWEFNLKKFQLPTKGTSTLFKLPIESLILCFNGSMDGLHRFSVSRVIQSYYFFTKFKSVHSAVWMLLWGLSLQI